MRSNRRGLRRYRAKTSNRRNPKRAPKRNPKHKLPKTKILMLRVTSEDLARLDAAAPLLGRATIARLAMRVGLDRLDTSKLLDLAEAEKLRSPRQRPLSSSVDKPSRKTRSRKKTATNRESVPDDLEIFFLEGFAPY